MEGRGVRGTLLDEAPIGVLLVSADELVIKDANQTFCRLGGWTRDELVGISVAKLAHADDLRSAPWDTSGVMAGHVITRERRFRRADGEILWCRTSTKLTDQGFLVLVSDLTPQLREREQLRLLEQLARLRSELADTLTAPEGSLPTVLDRAAAGLTAIIADACVISLAEPDLGLLVPTAFHHRDPFGEETLRATFGSHPMSLAEGLAARVAVRGAPLRLTDLSPAEVRDWLPKEYQPYAERYPIRNALVVPLRGGEGIVGTLAVARDLPYTDQDQQLVLDLAHWVARAIEDARHDAELRRANFLLQTVTGGLPAMVTYWDANHRNVYANEAACRFFGMTSQEMRGKRIQEVVGDEGFASGFPFLQRAIGGEVKPFRREVTDAAGRHRHIEVSMVPHLGPDGKLVGVVTMATDVTDWTQAAAELEFQALHDPLTGLANRRALLDHLALALKQLERGGGAVALFYLDLDDFKAINDTKGHQVGDTVLVTAADRIRGIVRQGDTAARLGGDEFVILCRVPDTAEAEDVRHRLRSALAQPIQVAADRTLQVTASVGLAIAREGASTSPEELLAAADAAMFADKPKP